MTGTEYEIFVKNFLEALAKISNAPDRKFIHQKTYTGLKRQWKVDISYSFADLGFNHWVFVECKNWNKVIDINTVTWIHDCKEDCGAHKAIAVSTLGFTKPAFELARKLGVGLGTLSDKNEFTIDLNFDGNPPDALLPYSNARGVKDLAGFIYPSQTVFEYLATRINHNTALLLQKGDFMNFFSYENDKLEVEINFICKCIEEYCLLATGGFPLQIPPEYGANTLYFDLMKYKAEQLFHG